MNSIFTHALPAITTLLSGVCFLSVGVLFGFSETSDSFFLIVSIQGALGSLFQITWHSVVPLLYSRKAILVRSVIVSTTLANLLILGVAYIIAAWALEKDFSSYFNASASAYFLFFQLHIFFKQLCLTEGKLKQFYILDGVGYTASIFTLLLLSVADPRLHTLSNIFNALLFCWAGTCAIDCYLHRGLLKPVYSKRLSLISLRKGVTPRIAGLLYSSKDFIIPLVISQYSTSGTVTLYAYISRILLALYQTVSLHIVNIWISTPGILDSTCTMKKVKRTANRAILAFGSATTLVAFFLMVFFFLIQQDAVKALFTFQSMVICVALFILFAVQTFEQPYSRIAYLKRSFRTQIMADACNFLFFILTVGIALSTGSILAVLIGATLSQVLSFLIYRHAVMRLLE